jgi:hypothetical protein
MARVFGHRRDAYLDYLSTLGTNYNSWTEWEMEHLGEEPPELALVGLWGHLTTVKIYGTPEAVRLAESLYEWLRIDMFGSSSTKAKDHASGYDQLSGEFVEQIRRDLGIELRPGAQQVSRQ